MGFKAPQKDIVPFKAPSKDRIGDTTERTGASNNSILGALIESSRLPAEIGGSVVGGMMGLPLGPIGAAAGGALGYGVARTGMDALERTLGSKQRINLSEVPGEVGSALYGGAMAESGGLVAGRAAKLAVAGIGGAAKRFLPGIAKSTAGIPEQATEIALNNPEVLSKPPVPADSLSKTVGQPIIDAMTRTKQGIGKRFGDIYRKIAGMEGPMQEIIDTPIAQKLSKSEKAVPVAQKLIESETKDIGTGLASKKFSPGEMVMGKEVSFKPGRLTTVPRTPPSYDDLLIDKNLAKQAFEEGDAQALKKLYETYVGTAKSDLSLLNIKNADKLQILTRLKRGTQKLAEFNKAPITNAPIDTAKDAAFKKMSADIDKLRDKVPGGSKLALVDDAWHQVNDIFDTIQKDLSDPGKARDTMMRILKGDNTWATSGKFGEKIKRIKVVEKMMGKSILKPAMDELTRQVFNEWTGKGFASQTIRGLAAVGSGAAFYNPALLPLAGASLAATSPKILGLGIRGASKAGAAIQSAAPTAGKIATIAAMGFGQKRKRE